jgi:hypothetical protein
VARHEVLGTAPPQKSLAVGYGLIRGNVHTDSTIREMKVSIVQDLCPERLNRFVVKERRFFRPDNLTTRKNDPFRQCNLVNCKASSLPAPGHEVSNALPPPELPHS